MHSVAKRQKIEGEKLLFSEKMLTVPKKIERGTLWVFPTSILTQNSKKMKGEPFGEIQFIEKNLAVQQKKLKGGYFGPARYGMLRGKTGKTF